LTETDDNLVCNFYAIPELEDTWTGEA